MKKIQSGIIIFSFALSVNAYSIDNLFAPKDLNITNENIKIVIQERIDEQNFQMENYFLKRIDDLEKKLENSQNKKYDEILTDIKNNQKTQKEKEENYKTLYQNSVVDINLDDEKLEYDEDSYLLLNKEYGEEALVFKGIVGDKKIYITKSGEYIIKNLDFVYKSDGIEGKK